MPNPTLPATVFKSPAIALSGVVDYDMYTKFRTQFDKASDQNIVVIELSTLGGDPEVARMMGEDVRFASEMEPARRFVFFGKAAIYSAGVTFMSFFAKGTHLKVTGGKQPATCYLMNAAGLFCFNQITGGLRRWFRDHAASLYLVGDGSGRLLGQRAYQHWSAPKLDRILARKALGLSDGLAIISANHRLIPDEVPLRSHHVSAVFWHHRGACKPGDVSHPCM
jgi:hypothetical protein